MTTKRFVKLAAALFALCGMTQAATFYWDGGGQSVTDWDYCLNWSDTCAELHQYPSTCSDDAVIPDGGDTDDSDDFRVDLVSNSSAQGIDSLTIEEDTEFRGDAGAPVLPVEALVIYGDGEEVRVSLRNANTSIYTANCP